MARIELDGRKIDAPITDVRLREVGFGADVIDFRIGDVIASIPVLELLEMHQVSRRSPKQHPFNAGSRKMRLPWSLRSIFVSARSVPKHRK